MNKNVFETRTEILVFLTDYFLGVKGALEPGWIGSNFILTVGAERFE